MADTSASDKDKYIQAFIRSFNEIEEAIEPYKQHRRELRKEFKDNGWLNSQEIAAAIKAYRILKQKGNMDEIYDAYNSIVGLSENEEEQN